MQKKLFKILPFYNPFIEKPEIKKLSNVQLLKELPFYDEVSILRNESAFSGYARSYRIEIIDKRDPIIQLKASQSSITDLFKDLLNEMKGFKYQITLSYLLNKVRSDGNIEYSPIYFNSTTKTVINSDNLILISLFKRFYTELIIGLMKDQDGSLKKYTIST